MNSNPAIPRSRLKTPLKIHILNNELALETTPRYQRKRKPPRDLPRVMTPGVVGFLTGLALAVGLLVGALMANLGWHPPL